ncbi:MAG: phosphotransferase [Acidobacteriota bacterium]|nr:phosphotransferase [Acidobacteriota bacterium]MDH3784195.1 phosphotransferase [Acidobacteriota bacterium]
MRSEVQAIFGRPDGSTRLVGVEAMAGDASTRRFHRCRLDEGQDVVVMDYGTPFKGETDDLRLQRIFVDADLPCAEVLSVHPDPGCVVWADLGQLTLEASLRRSTRRPDWLAAVQLAARIADQGTPVLAGSDLRNGPRLDGTRFRREMDFFVTHFIGGHLNVQPPAAILTPLLHRLADEAGRCPQPVLCHRDFHSRNIVLSDGGDLALVDLQDACWGPDSYDLASWLYDAYFDRPDDWVSVGIETFVRDRLDADEVPRFQERLEPVAAQRMLKALGTFGFQAASRGEPRYLEGVPRTVSRLRTLLPRFPLGEEILAILDPIFP